MVSNQLLAFFSYVSILCLITSETLTSSSSTSIELLNEQQSTDIISTSARSRSFQRQQSVYNNGGNNGNNLNHNNKMSFGLHNNLPPGCCSCNECCACDSGSDYPEIYDDPPSLSSSSSHSSPSLLNPSSSPLNNLQSNRFGSTTRRSVIVRRRYLRPNGGITVVEVEETPNAPPPPSPLSPLPSPLTLTFGNLNRLTGTGIGGSSLFGGNQNVAGGSLFSRFIPSALERGNSTRKRPITFRANQPIPVTINNRLTINSTRHNSKSGIFPNNNSKRKN